MRLSKILQATGRRIGTALVKAAGGTWENAFKRETVYGDAETYGVRLFDTMTERMGAMSSIGIVYACVNLIAESFAQVPWHLDDTEGNEREMPELRALLSAPNPDTSGFELLYTVMAHLELTGNAFVYLGGIDGSALFARDAKGLPRLDADGKLVIGDRPHFGKPHELFILEPDRMKVAKTAQDRIAGYAYRSPTTYQDVPLERDWVLHLKYPHPANRWWGLGPVEAAALTLEQTVYADRWNRNFFRNSARPDGIIEAPEGLSDEQYERIKQQWSVRHKGVDNAHRTAILEGANYKTVGASAKDMDFFIGKELTREETCSIFGVPPAKIGVLRYANYASSREQDKTFWAETMTPKLLLVAAKITSELVARWDPTLTFVFADMNPRDAVLEANTAVALAGAGLRTINELRAEYRWGDHVPWGDAFWVPPGRYPITGSEAPPQRAPAISAGGQPALPAPAPPPEASQPSEEGPKHAQDRKAATQSPGTTTDDQAPEAAEISAASLRPAPDAPRAEWQPYWRKVMAEPQEALEPDFRRELLPLFQEQEREVREGLKARRDELDALIEAAPQREAMVLLAEVAEHDMALAEFLAADDEFARSNRGLRWAARHEDSPRLRYVAERLGELGELYEPAVRAALAAEICTLGLEGLAARVKADPQKPVNGIVEGAIDWNGQRETFRVGMEPQHKLALETGGKGAFQELAVGASFDLADPDALAALDVISHAFADDVTDTTKRQIQETLYAGIQEGEGVPKLMDRVSDVFAVAKGPRAENIARTETARAVNAGRLEGFGQSGVVERQEWIATFDDRTRETHLEAHGQIVALDEPFQIGGYEAAYPGDPALPPEESCQCRCAVAPLVEGEGGEAE